MFSKERKPLEMIVLFKMVVQGENKPVSDFFVRVKNLAAEEGVKIHDFENIFMMPTTNIFHEDQTEMALHNVREYK